MCEHPNPLQFTAECRVGNYRLFTVNRLPRMGFPPLGATEYPWVHTCGELEDFLKEWGFEIAQLEKVKELLLPIFLKGGPDSLLPKRYIYYNDQILEPFRPQSFGAPSEDYKLWTDCMAKQGDRFVSLSTDNDPPSYVEWIVNREYDMVDESFDNRDAEVHSHDSVVVKPLE